MGNDSDNIKALSRHTTGGEASIATEVTTTPSQVATFEKGFSQAPRVLQSRNDGILRMPGPPSPIASIDSSLPAYTKRNYDAEPVQVKFYSGKVSWNDGPAGQSRFIKTNLSPSLIGYLKSDGLSSGKTKLIGRPVTDAEPPPPYKRPSSYSVHESKVTGGFNVGLTSNELSKKSSSEIEDIFAVGKSMLDRLETRADKFEQADSTASKVWHGLGFMKDAKPLINAQLQITQKTGKSIPQGVDYLDWK